MDGVFIINKRKKCCYVLNSLDEIPLFLKERFRFKIKKIPVESKDTFRGFLFLSINDYKILLNGNKRICFEQVVGVPLECMEIDTDKVTVYDSAISACLDKQLSLTGFEDLLDNKDDLFWVGKYIFRIKGSNVEWPEKHLIDEYIELYLEDVPW